MWVKHKHLRRSFFSQMHRNILTDHDDPSARKLSVQLSLLQPSDLQHYPAHYHSQLRPAQLSKLTICTCMHYWAVSVSRLHEHEHRRHFYFISSNSQKYHEFLLKKWRCYLFSLWITFDFLKKMLKSLLKSDHHISTCLLDILFQIWFLLRSTLLWKLSTICWSVTVVICKISLMLHKHQCDQDLMWEKKQQVWDVMSASVHPALKSVSSYRDFLHNCALSGFGNETCVCEVSIYFWPSQVKAQNINRFMLLILYVI